MATPFAAGVYALLIEARKTKDPTVLARILSTTATPIPYQNMGTTYDILAPVAQQGAGLIQAFDAAHVSTLVSHSNIAFNDSDHFASPVTFTVTNLGFSSVTYSISHTKAATVYTFIDDALNFAYEQFPPVDSWASLSFSQTTISLSAGQSTNITITATPPTGLNNTRLPIYSGYILLTATTGNNDTLSIPYMGVAGSMYSTPIWGPSMNRVYLERDYLSDFPPGVPPNSTFTVPVPTSPDANNSSNPDAVIPGFHAEVTLASAIRHYLLVPLSVNGTVKTTNVLGYQSAGDVTDWIPPPFEKVYGDGHANLGDYPITGMLADGTIMPEGYWEIRFLALRVFGDPTRREDYDSVGLPFFFKYEKGG
jgi:hypothetical protein